MQVIEIRVKEKKHKIEWALSEHFGELINKSFMLNEVSAEQIEKINDLSSIAKILLSAVSGAVIQYLMDIGYEVDVIFGYGTFKIIDVELDK